MLRTALCLSTLFVFAAAGTVSAEDAPKAAGHVDRKCETAQRRVAKEEKSLAAAEQELILDRRGKESCATQGACARFDSAIKSMEARKARHETRLGKFKADAEQDCKRP
jgi:hypothetical protein